MSIDQQTALPATTAEGEAIPIFSPAPDGEEDLLVPYITQLRNQAATLFGATVAATLVPVRFSGNLNWFWTTGAGDVNELTYNYISGAVTSSPDPTAGVTVGAAGSYANLYRQLINGISWQFSAADLATLQEAETRSAAQAASLVSAYVATYGQPTPEQMEAAKKVNPVIVSTLDYIVQYVIAYLWADVPTTSSGLTLLEMQESSDLRRLLSRTPASGQQIVMLFTSYLNALGTSATLIDMQSLGGYTLARLRSNLTPSASNGGIQLSNPSSGTTYYLGYSSNELPASILQDLQNTGQSITVSLTSSRIEDQTYDISFSGSAPVRWNGALLVIKAGSSFEGDVGAQRGSGTRFSITMRFPGVTIIPFFPTPYVQTSAGATGWFNEAVIYQAWQNLLLGPNAASGFTFLNAVPGGIKLGNGGLGYPSALVVSGDPTITVDFEDGNYDEFRAWLSTHESFSVTMFGVIPVGSSTVNTFVATTRQEAGQVGFTLTLTPPPPGSQGQTIPAADQTVPVLAAQVYWTGELPS